MNFLDLAIKSILAGAFGWTAIYALRRSSAAMRHTALFLALLGVCVVPVASYYLPRWHVPFVTLTEKAPVSESAVAASQVTVAPAGSVAPVSASVDWSPLEILLAIWVLVAGVLCARMAMRLLYLGRAERKLAMNVDPDLQALVAERCRQSGRHVLLLQGLDNEPPMTWGHYRPVLVLPAEAAHWPQDRLNSVVLHELAHIERGDWLASMFVQLACAVYWFNPIVWAIKRRMEVESETAADDRVLNMGIPATQYASHLVDVSKELFVGRSSTRVALAMARPGKLDQRVRAILEARRNRRTVRGGVALVMAALVAGVVAIVAAAAPTVVHLKAAPADVATSSRPPEVELGETETRDDINEDNAEQVADGTESGTDDATPAELKAAVPVKKLARPAAAPAPRVPAAPAPSVGVGTIQPSGGVVIGKSKAGTGSASASSGDVSEIDINMGDFEAEMKEANAEVSKATKEADVEIAKSGIKDKKFLEGLSQLVKTSATFAMQSASKVTKAGLAQTMKSLKTLSPSQKPPADKPKH